MYTVVTGAAGFVGANLVRSLNARGEREIIAVDRLDATDKFRNLVGCDLADYLDADEFAARLEDGDFDGDLSAVLHQGACSDTMERDGAFMMRNNYRYSARLLQHCLNEDVPFLYASSDAAGLPSAARTALTTDVATALYVSARPLPTLKMPDRLGWSRKSRLTLTTSSTDTKSRRCSPFAMPPVPSNSLTSPSARTWRSKW